MADKKTLRMFQHVRLLQSFCRTEIIYLDYRKTELINTHVKHFNTNYQYVRLTPCSVVFMELLEAQCVNVKTISWPPSELALQPLIPP